MHKKSFVFGFVIAFLLAGGGIAQAADAPDLLKNATQKIALVKSGEEPVWRDALVMEKPGTYNVAGRIVFTVEDPSVFTALEFHKPTSAQRWVLNGRAVPLPIEKGMYYKTVPGVPASLLRKGQNVLTASWRVRVRTKNAKVALNARLLGLGPDMLRFQTGPILGCAGADYFTVTCRTNMIAAVMLSVGGRTFTSKPGLMHAFKARELKDDREYAYTLKASLPDGKTGVTIGPFKVRTLPNEKKLFFAVLGDNRNNPRTWARVTKAVAGHRPAFAVNLGDLVGNGNVDHQWNEQYFGPGKEYFATIPRFVIMGNHEWNAPLFLRMLRTPNGKLNWSQQIGPVLLIGIEGLSDWSREGKLARWLEGVLSGPKGRKAKFIFLCNHYPAWSSYEGGGKRTDTTPKYKYVRQARYVVMPLLKKYNATAYLAGHDHFYERSEPDDGVTVIISGGAGAPLFPKNPNCDPKIQNPYSKAFAKKFHYCLFTADGGTCTMKALTLDGKVIDTKQWKARKV